jgi:hypothetical protein
MACEVVFQKDFKAMLQHKLDWLHFWQPSASSSASILRMTGLMFISQGGRCTEHHFQRRAGRYLLLQHQRPVKNENPYTESAEKSDILQIANLAVAYSSKTKAKSSPMSSIQNIPLAPKYAQTA